MGNNPSAAMGMAAATSQMKGALKDAEEGAKGGNPENEKKVQEIKDRNKSNIQDFQAKKAAHAAKKKKLSEAWAANRPK
eukprot:CAMPEP_0119567754 /NCGR_PEP_ID=MMETSP1352-20130426/36887_1 /TAXON_ID=265584 /ORGANISM="Stauroneis constricta, Strain CCMP1120" /LENGTH=78 /DNA_ID=CAMNT_0007617043 /DNA_START=91 /DNA_END=327 /DNA_ORIENTATION=+